MQRCPIGAMAPVRASSRVPVMAGSERIVVMTAGGLGIERLDLYAVRTLVARRGTHRRLRLAATDTRRRPGGPWQRSEKARWSDEHVAATLNRLEDTFRSHVERKARRRLSPHERDPRLRVRDQGRALPDDRSKPLRRLA